MRKEIGWTKYKSNQYAKELVDYIVHDSNIGVMSVLTVRLSYTELLPDILQCVFKQRPEYYVCGKLVRIPIDDNYEFDVVLIDYGLKPIYKFTTLVHEIIHFIAAAFLPKVATDIIDFYLDNNKEEMRKFIRLFRS